MLDCFLASIIVKSPEQKVKVSCSKKATNRSSFQDFGNFTFFVSPEGSGL